jgi:hypothetical protein
MATKSQVPGGNGGHGVRSVKDVIAPEHLVKLVRARAHEIFMQRGDKPGSALGDWLRAEQEIKAKYGIK